ncbi:ADP-ribosyltransferase, partial [Streptomyces sp. NPDC001155]
TFNVLTTVFTGGEGAAVAGAGKAGAVAKAISVAGKVGRVIDPMTYVMKGAGAGLSKIGDIAKNIKGIGKIDLPALPEGSVHIPEGSVNLPGGHVLDPNGNLLDHTGNVETTTIPMDVAHTQLPSNWTNHTPGNVPHGLAQAVTHDGHVYAIPQAVDTGIPHATTDAAAHVPTGVHADAGHASVTADGAASHVPVGAGAGHVPAVSPVPVGADAAHVPVTADGAASHVPVGAGAGHVPAVSPVPVGADAAHVPVAAGGAASHVPTGVYGDAGHVPVAPHVPVGADAGHVPAAAHGAAPHVPSGGYGDAGHVPAASHVPSGGYGDAGHVPSNSHVPSGGYGDAGHVPGTPHTPTGGHGTPPYTPWNHGMPAHDLPSHTPHHTDTTTPHTGGHDTPHFGHDTPHFGDGHPGFGPTPHVDTAVPHGTDAPVAPGHQAADTAAHAGDHFEYKPLMSEHDFNRLGTDAEKHAAAAAELERGTNPYPSSSNEAAKEYADAYWGDHVDNIDPQAKGTLERYSSFYFQYINGDLRDFARDGTPVKPQEAQWIADMDRVIGTRPVPEDIMVLRETAVDHLDLRSPLDMQGHVYTEPGFTSVSLGESSVRYNDVTFHLRVPKGTHGLYIEGISLNPGERELIIDRGAQYKVTRVFQDERGKWHAYGEILPKPKP